MSYATEAIARGKREILEDIQNGVVPADVRSLSDLNEHVDANEYGGLCDVSPGDTMLGYDDWMETLNDVQEALNLWLMAGRREDMTEAYRAIAADRTK